MLAHRFASSLEKAISIYYSPFKPIKFMKATVKIRRAEGPSALCGTWNEYQSIKEAERALSQASHTFPKLGYDKHDYSVTFENGDEYEGRLDCTHPENEYYNSERNSIFKAATDYLKYLLKTGGNNLAQEEADEIKRYIGNFESNYYQAKMTIE